MSDIFALKGKANCGKSQTIREVFEILKSKYPSAPINVLIAGLVDIKVEIMVKGMKVGIESQGDPNSRLKQSLSDFVANNCDIIICATRTSGMTTGWVDSYSANYNINYIHQVYAAKGTHTTSNRTTAQNIIRQAGL